MDLTKIAEFVNPLWSTLLGAPGLWAFVKSKTDKNITVAALTLKLVRYRIIEEGERYIERGYILSGEYSDFYEELYKPYVDMGGNGLAQLIFERIKKLPMLPDGSEERGRHHDQQNV